MFRGPGETVPLSILHRYVLKEHVGPLVFALSILVSILLMNQIVRFFDKIVGKGLQLTVILQVFGLCIPFILATTMPMAVLVATLWAFGRLSSDNEIVAMKANGISILSIIRPLLIAGFLLTLVMIWFDNHILPETNYMLRSLLLDISYQKPTIEIKEGILMDDFPGYSILVQEIDRDNSHLHDVTIYDATSEGSPRTILAKEGTMSFSEDRRDLFLRLKDGEIHLVDPEDLSTYERVEFRTQTIVLKDVGGRFRKREHGTYRTDREMSTRMMREEVARNRERLKVLLQETEALRSERGEDRSGEAAAGDTVRAEAGVSTPGGPPDRAEGGKSRRLVELQKKELEIEALTKRNNQLMVEVHKKYAIPFASLILILVGVPLRLTFKSGGAGTVIILSLIIFLSYYIFLVGGENLGDRGYISPFFAMWTPNLLFGALGLVLLFKTTREASALSLSFLNPLALFRGGKE